MSTTPHTRIELSITLALSARRFVLGDRGRSGSNVGRSGSISQNGSSQDQLSRMGCLRIISQNGSSQDHFSEARRKRVLSGSILQKGVLSGSSPKMGHLRIIFQRPGENGCSQDHFCKRGVLSGSSAQIGASA